MMEPFKHEFRVQYDRAFKLYVKGEWQMAKLEFQITIEMVHETFKNKKGGKDPLSTNLINFMEKYDFQPPEDWKGYKPFDE